MKNIKLKDLYEGNLTIENLDKIHKKLGLIFIFADGKVKRLNKDFRA